MENVAGFGVVGFEARTFVGLLCRGCTDWYRFLGRDALYHQMLLKPREG